MTVDIDLEIAQAILDKKIEQLLNDPLLSPHKDRLKIGLHQAAKPVRVRTYPQTEFGGISKRTARGDMLAWLKQQLGDTYIANVYDLAGPGGNQLTELWQSDLMANGLYRNQITRVTLIDRNEELIKGINPHPLLKQVIHGDVWDVMPVMLQGKGARGNAVISLDFYGTLHGAQAGENINPDCAVALPRLLVRATGRYPSLCIYLTVAVRGEGGKEQLKTEMEQLGSLMTVGRWTCAAQQIQSYNDTHPMMSGMYLMKK
jgi:hypothetical protein